MIISMVQSDYVSIYSVICVIRTVVIPNLPVSVVMDVDDGKSGNLDKRYGSEFDIMVFVALLM